MTAECCPICKRPLPHSQAGRDFTPFCSKRCADVDLGRWLTGSYAIPAAEPDDEDDAGVDGEPKSGDNGYSPH